MRVLLINNFFYPKGGSETVFFNTGKLLKKNGHTVHYFSLNREENLLCQDSRFFPGSFDEKPVLKRIMSYIYNFDAASKLDLFLKDNPIDIAHIHLFWGGLSPSILHVLKKHHIPAIHTAHDYRMLCPSYLFLGRDQKICERCHRGCYLSCLLNKCAKNSIAYSILMMIEMYFRIIFSPGNKYLSGIIYVSDFSMLKHFNHSNTFRSIESIRLYNFTSNSRKDKFRENRKKKYDVYIGRLSREKGISDLIKAWKISGIKKELHIIGDGPQKEELKQLADRLSVTNVYFDGFYDKEKISNVLTDADYLILPSIWYENNPMTIIEAFSMGCPAIGMDIGGISELIGNRNGFLISYPATPESIAKTLREADSISDSEYYLLQKNCHLTYTQNFTEEIYYNRLLGFYNRIMNRHNTTTLEFDSASQLDSSRKVSQDL